MPIPVSLTNRLKALQDEAATLVQKPELSDEDLTRIEEIPTEIEAVKGQIDKAKRLDASVADSRKLMAEPATKRPFNTAPAPTEAPASEGEGEAVKAKNAKVEVGDSEIDKLAGTGGFKTMGHFTYTLVKAQTGDQDAVKSLSRWVGVAAAKHKIAYDSEHERNAIKAAIGMGITADPTADIFVPMEFSRDIYERVEGIENDLIVRSDRLTVGGSSIRLPAFDDADRSAAFRNGGVVAYWEGEGDSAALTKIDRTRFQDFRLKRVTAAVAATDELLSDTAYPLETIISRKAADALRFRVSQAIWEGDGSSLPLGITKSRAIITIAKEAGQGNATVVAANIDKMWQSVTASCRANGVWFINQEVEQQLSTMFYATGANSGQLVYMPPTALSGQPYATLKGRPIVPLEFASALGDAFDIVFADLSKYRLVMKGEASRDVSMHVRFLTHEPLFRFSMRMDGQPLWDQPIKPLKGSSNFRTSCFVGLGARTS